MLEFKENMVVHCDTEEKAIKFLDECEKQGCKWLSGAKPLSEYHRWNKHKENTCYLIAHCRPRKSYFLVSMQELDYFRENGYRIIKFNHLSIIKNDRTE